MSKLKSKVMRRVYAFWFLRTAYHSLALKFLGIGVLAFALRQMVSLKSVVINTLQVGGVDRMVGYLEYAFTHTQTSVQITFALMALLAVWTIIDAMRKDFTMPELMTA